MDSRQRALDAAVQVISSGKIGGGVSIDHVPTLAQRFLDFLDPDPAEVGSQEMTALREEAAYLIEQVQTLIGVVADTQERVKALEDNVPPPSRSKQRRAPETSTTETTPPEPVDMTVAAEF